MDIDPGFIKLNHRKDRLKTTGTSDTYELLRTENHPNHDSKPRNTTFTRPLSNKKRGSTAHRNQQHHNKSLNSALAPSPTRHTTVKHKVKRLMSTSHHESSRMKTECNEPGLKRVGQLRRKLVFPAMDDYRLQAFKVLKMVHQTPQEQFFTATKGTMGSKIPKKFTLIKVNEAVAKRHERERRAYSQLSQQLCREERHLLLKVQQVWKEKRQWMVATDHFLAPDWEDPGHELFLSGFKNNPALINLFIQQLALVLSVFSAVGLAHGSLTINSVFFPVVKGALQAQARIKVGNLARTIPILDKQQLLRMPLRYHTPPEVLNLILFEQGEPFDRESLEQVSELSEGWQIDAWSLAITTLELLNGGPLSGWGSDCCTLLRLQRELLIRYSYLLQRLDCPAHLCLSSMLSLNPKSRPSPRQIMQLLEDSN